MMQKRQNQEKLLRVPCPLDPAREREGSARRGGQGWPAACLPAFPCPRQPGGRESASVREQAAERLGSIHTDVLLQDRCGWI